MEPERDIEKELKAYAQQRRAAAGTPPPLHPANRKALQAEAARLAKSPDAKPRSWWQIFFSSWPGLAVAGAAAAVVVIVASHTFSSAAKRRSEFQSLAANREPAEKRLRSEPAPAPQPAAPANSPNADAEKPSIALTEAGSPPPPQAAAVPDSSAVQTFKTSPPPRPMSPAGHAVTKTESQALALDNNNSPLPPPVTVATAAPAVPESSSTVTFAATAPAPAPAVTPAAGAPPTATRLYALKTPASADRDALSVSGQLKDANGFAGSAGTAAKGGAITGSSGFFDRLVTADMPSVSVTQRFRRTGLPAKAPKPFGISNLLANFKVEQELGKIRVIDGDGSIYLGYVEQMPESGKQKDAELQQELLAKKADEVSTAKPTQAFYFRVSGTNRTLKQEVVFSGNFLTTVTSQSAFATNASFGAASASVAPGAIAQPVLFELQKARVEGRLQLGGTNKLEIKAAPVKR